MTISQRALRSASYKISRIVKAQTLTEASEFHKQTAFLSHSHKDLNLAKGLQVIFQEAGWDVYIDYHDDEMPPIPTEETAGKIQEKIRDCDSFLYLATENSTKSRWCPWEIGYADSAKGKESIMIVPTIDDSNNFFGNEYLKLYKKITDATYEDRRSGYTKEGYAVFSPGTDEGGLWIGSL